MECPKCRGAMVAVEREGIELDWCPSCPGLWFDAGEFDLLAETMGLPPSEPDLSHLAPADNAESARRCPRCDRRMEKVWFDPASTILVDRCRHGLWFDRGELGSAFESMRSRASGGPGTIVSFLGESFRR